jgi:hypothetical protein
MSEKLTLELNGGREEPDDRNSTTYAGIALSTSF